MPARKRVFLPSRAVLIVAFGLAVSGAPALPATSDSAQRASAATSCVDGWRHMPLASGLSYIEPHGAEAVGGRPGWIVAGPNTGSLQRPYILRWSSGRWAGVTPPWSRYGSLLSVDALRADVAWAVGNLGRPVGTAIAATWNGSSWQNVALPPLGGSMSTFADVAVVSRTDAWAVGGRLVKGQLKPLAWFRGTGGWSNASPTVGNDEEAGLTAAQLTSDGRIWAGGWRTTDGLQQPWLVHREGEAWQQVSVDQVNGPGAITDLAFRAPDDGWLVGYVENLGGGYIPLLQHWDGSTWTNVSPPWTPSDSVMLRSVAVDAAGRIAVAGQSLTGGFRRAALAVRDNGTWRIRAIPGSQSPSSSFLTSIAATDEGFFTTGLFSGSAGALATCTASGDQLSTTARSSEVDAQSEEQPPDATLQQASVSSVEISGLTARDRTAASGLGMSTTTFGGLVADFDGDTHSDVLINRHVGHLKLMAGTGTGFTELALPWTWQDRHGCDVADVDRDGLLDLYCTVGAARGTRATGNELVLHPATGDGVITTSEYGVLNAWGRGRHATFFNLDGDEYPDLYVSAEPERIDAQQSANRLYRNVSGQYYQPVPSWKLNRSMGGECLISADVDHDADDDILVCATKAVDGMARGARLYVNESGTLTDRTVAWRISPIGDIDVEVADFDGDGQLDLAQLSHKQLRISVRGDTGFRQTFSYGFTRAVAMAVGDVNGDRRADVYVSQQTAGNDDHAMLVNNGRGAAFTSMTIPQAPGGSANDVLAIDYDGNGLTDFVTLNGRYSAGPVRLTAFYRDAAVR